MIVLLIDWVFFGFGKLQVDGAVLCVVEGLEPEAEFSESTCTMTC
jgi:hypothetical protein